MKKKKFKNPFITWKTKYIIMITKRKERARIVDTLKDDYESYNNEEVKEYIKELIDWLE